VTAFVASQIVISTMFLRWHYLVDVVVGFSLACALAWLAPIVARWEGARRSGRRPLFSPLRWRARASHAA
jgi:membrane-associated phospholipid phosphatase